MKSTPFPQQSLLFVFATKHDTSVQPLRSWVLRHLQNPFTLPYQSKLSFRSVCHKLLTPMQLALCLSQGKRLQMTSFIRDLRHKWRNLLHQTIFCSFGAAGEDKNIRLGAISNERAFFFKKKRNDKHFSNVLKFIFKIFEMTW